MTTTRQTTPSTLKASARLNRLAVCLIALFLSACGSVYQSSRGNSSDADSTQTVEHALGKTAVPQRPERIIVMNPVADLDNLLALGVKPVGFAGFTSDRPFAVPPYLASQVDGIETVGNLSQPNLEKTLQLDPDLIVVDASQQRLYRRLSQIAPTVGLDARVARWQERFLALAEAVNQTERAAQLLEEYDQKAEAFRQTLGDRLDELDVSYIRVRPDSVFLYVKSSPVGQIMDDLGIQRPPAQDVFLDDQLRISISLEELDKADGDVMFVFGLEFGDSEATFAQLQTNPLWQQLDAVKAEQVYIVTDAYWSFPGIQGATLLINDLTDYLGGADPL